MSRVTAGLAAALLLAGQARSADFAGGSDAWEQDLPRGALEAVGGAAAAAFAEDAAAATLNPAGLARVHRSSLVAGFARLPLGLSDGQVAGAIRVGGAGTLAAAARMLRADVAGAIEDVAGGYAGPGESAGLRTVVASAAWAPDLAEATAGLPVRLEAGVGVEVARRELAGEADTGGGGSLGVTARWREGIGAFARVRDLGWTDGGPWPLTVAAGGSWARSDLTGRGDRVRCAVAGVWGRERGMGGAALVELGIEGERFGVAARVGYEAGTVEHISPLPAFGLMLRAVHLTLDAGWRPLGAFGWATSLTIGWSSGEDDAGI